MAHNGNAYTKKPKVKEEPQFVVNNRKERRRLKSKKKGACEQSVNYGSVYK